MPITTSTITGTVAHKHSATGGSSDGGKLATGGLGGDTSFDLASGSLMYSNGTSLDELVIGGSGTVLTEVGGVPAWVSGGASGSFEFVDDQELTGTATYIDSSFASISGADVAQLQVILDLQRSNVATCNILMQYGSGGSLVSSGYYTSYAGTSIASGFYNNQPEWLLAINPNYRHLMTNAFISMPDPNMTTFNADMLMFSNSANTNPEGYICGCTHDGPGTTIDQIRVSVSAGNFEQGSKMSIFKLNRS